MQESVFRDKLIFDVGFHNGNDTDYYLRKGFDVVAIEANPQLVQKGLVRFKKEIDASALVIEAGAITAGEDNAVTFFASSMTDEWGTVSSMFRERNRGKGDHAAEITVPALRLADLLQRYGVPHYMKIDIEGADRVCLDELRSVRPRPPFISIKSEKESFDELVAEMEALQVLGYDRFKIIQQQYIYYQAAPNPSHEGLSIDYRFSRFSSGAFGRDLGGSWLSFDHAISRYESIFGLYRQFGDNTVWQTVVLLNFPKRVFEKVFRRAVPGWYDTHAMHQSV